jgi:HSP20 family molecular chaperone IbpA
MTKEDVSVKVTVGHLALSGERKRETEEKKDNFYRTEGERRQLLPHQPLPARGRQGDLADRILEVSVPLPTRPEPNVRWCGLKRSSSREGADMRHQTDVKR